MQAASLHEAKQRKEKTSDYLIYGAPAANRTRDPQLRRLMLYPTELRAPAGNISTYVFSARGY
jgi:hypothetical protein